MKKKLKFCPPPHYLDVHKTLSLFFKFSNLAKTCLDISSSILIIPRPKGSHFDSRFWLFQENFSSIIVLNILSVPLLFSLRTQVGKQSRQDPAYHLFLYIIFYWNKAIRSIYGFFCTIRDRAEWLQQKLYWPQRPKIFTVSLQNKFADSI